MSKVVVGIDLGGTNIKTAVVTEARELLAKSSRPTNADAGPEALMDEMADAVRDLLQECGKSGDDVIAACFGAPGPMNWQTGVVYSPPNLPGWKNVPLADEMRQRLDFPCFVDNDANVACYGEFWMGAGRGTENMAVLTLGTGVGGGVIVFGKLLRGPDGTAAELGHLVVQRIGGRKSTSPAVGALEAYASVTGMVRTAVEGLQEGEDSSLRRRCNEDFSVITGEMISEEASKGDPFAKWVFEETATWLALGITSIIHYQNPEKVVLCGGMIAAGDMLFDTVRRVVRENTFEVPGNRCEIVPAGLGSDSGVLGAAGCAYARAMEKDG